MVTHLRLSLQILNFKYVEKITFFFMSLCSYFYVPNMTL